MNHSLGPKLYNLLVIRVSAGLAIYTLLYLIFKFFIKLSLDNISPQKCRIVFVIFIIIRYLYKLLKLLVRKILIKQYRPSKTTINIRYIHIGHVNITIGHNSLANILYKNKINYHFMEALADLGK